MSCPIAVFCCCVLLVRVCVDCHSLDRCMFVLSCVMVVVVVRLCASLFVFLRVGVCR